MNRAVHRPQPPELRSERREVGLDANEHDGASLASVPLTLGYASAFGIRDASDLEPLTAGSEGPRADSDVPPFGHSYVAP